MIPRLQPRSSVKQPTGVENVYPIDRYAPAKTSTPPTSSDSSTSLVTSFPRSSEASQKPLSDTNDKNLFSTENTTSNEYNDEPLSPSRSSVEYEKEVTSPLPNIYRTKQKNLSSSYYHSTSSSVETDASSMSHCDFPLTPPIAGSRPPLIVSAKRYGSEVRRQHSKRRRRRRRPSCRKQNSEKFSIASGKAVNGLDSDFRKKEDGDALCLWKDNSVDETDGTYLPSLDSSDEEHEETERIEEMVRAEHIKEAMDARGNEKHQRHNRSFSANRAPPSKGCLSNPRPKRLRGQATRYKTPPKSGDDMSLLSESNINQVRKVQFGIPSAVEYEIDRPPGHLTPMAQEVTRKRYSMDPKEPTREEEEITLETKQNNLILSEWEDQFSAALENKSRQGDHNRRRGSSSKNRNRRDRRSSAIFSPSSRISLAYEDFDVKHSKTSALTLTSSESNPAVGNIDSLLTISSCKEETNKQSRSQATPVLSARRVDESQTWNFVADLASINSKGALELSPHSLTSDNNESNFANATEGETENQPRRSVDFDTVNNSDSNEKDTPDQQHTSLKHYSNSDLSLSDCEGASQGSSAALSRILISTPRLDRQWEFLRLLRYLSSLGEKEEITTQRCFKLLDPCIENARYSNLDFVEKFFQTLSQKSFSQGSISNTNSMFAAERATLMEWRECEITSITNLTNSLDQLRLRMEESILLTNTCKIHLQSQETKLEEEIYKLENDIQQHKSMLGLLEASAAPLSSLSCHATAQMGIFGFLIQDFRENHTLELDYMHAIFDVKTRVSVGVNSLSRISINYVNAAPTNCGQNSVLDFHRQFISMLKCGKICFQPNYTELQDYLLRLGQILGKLDQRTLALNETIDGRDVAITVDLPHMHFSFPEKGVSASLTLDLTCFQTKKMSVSIDGMHHTVDKTEILSSVDCCNLESVSNIIFQYVE